MKLTQKVVAGVTVGLLVYEAWTLVNDKENDTISETIWEWIKTTPFVSFGGGVLCGHLFWQSKPAVVVHNVKNIEVDND